MVSNCCLFDTPPVTWMQKSPDPADQGLLKIKPGGDLLSQEGEPDNGDALLRPGERRELTSERPVPEQREGPHLR